MGINTPLTSSTGRLFDAVAAITGLCHVASFHAEAPMRLEGAIDKSEKGAYHFAIGETIDTTQIIREICNDMSDKTPVSVISARFHNSVINIIFAAAELISKESGIRKIALSGGSFQNSYILAKAEEGLAKMGFEVYTPEEIPANDGGIALGQLAIAAKIKNEKKEYRTS
jgi:hydrogenase maturation protein HypF